MMYFPRVLTADYADGFQELRHYHHALHSKGMSLAEIKTAVDQLSPKELAELAAFIGERDAAAWDREIDEDFDQGGRLRPVLDEVRDDLRAGRMEELP